MQGVLRPRLQLFRSTHISPQTAKLHKSSTSRRFRTMPEGFFLGRSLSHPIKPAFNHGVLRRTFGSGPGRDPFAAYTSSRFAMWEIIGLNAAVFGAWQYGIAKRDRNALDRLRQYFTVSIQNIRDGRYYTTLTSAFSHQNLFHFAFNMITFHAFGTILSAMCVGGLHFSALCIGSAITGSLSLLYHWQYNSSNRADAFRSGLGASGMVMGVGAVATCLVPFAPMQIMFIPINIPLWVLTIVYAAVDTYYLHSTSVGHAAHLGGSIFGVCYYFTFLKRFGGVWYMLGRGRGRWR